MKKLSTSLALLTTLAAPGAADAGSPEGHADKAYFVTFLQKGNWQYRIHTSKCQVLVKDTAAKRGKIASVADLTETSTVHNLVCKPGKEGCVNELAGTGATGWGSPPSLGFDDERLADAAMMCSKGLIATLPHFTWTWAGTDATSIDLAPSSAARFSQKTFKAGVLKSPPSAVASYGKLQLGANQGICRVRFFGADYLGTIEDAATIGHESGQTIWKWSSAQHKYVAASSVGSGTKCRVRFGTGSLNGVPDIGTFTDFDVLEAKSSYRWSNYTPGAAVPSDAVPLGTRRNKVLYACRAKHEHEGPPNFTTGTRYLFKDTQIGYYVEGSDQCIVPGVGTTNTSNVEIRILRNPI